MQQPLDLLHGRRVTTLSPPTPALAILGDTSTHVTLADGPPPLVILATARISVAAFHAPTKSPHQLTTHNCLSNSGPNGQY